MNVMILSPGRRVEIVEYFKTEIAKYNGNVFTLDMSPYSSALYSGDKSFCIDKDFGNLSGYMSETFNICCENNVDLLLTLIDPELPLLAEYRSEFERSGIQVMISARDLTQNTLDKYLFYEEFADKIPLVWTGKNKEEVKKCICDGTIEYPIFAKPRNGSGSVGLATIINQSELDQFHPTDEYIYQPFSKKREYGVDMYFSMADCQLKQCFIKEKVAMRSGETDKAVSVHNKDILDIAMRLSGIGFRGTVDMDVFLGFDGNYYVNEINPRFGGGYPHAYYCGMNYIENILIELNGQTVKKPMNEYEDDIVMMKYNNYFFMKKA
jgi:Carbamoylphosphate synthase large subunit (split gene in MJ)